MVRGCLPDQAAGPGGGRPPAGYLIQSISVPNAAVLVFVTGCNVGRAFAEERVLAGSADSSADYEAYRQRVWWRLVPGMW